MGFANSGLGSAELIMKARRDLSTLAEETETYVAADIAYILICSVMVMLITPAIAMYYGGTLKRKNIIQLLFQSYMVTAVITIQWFLFGYSLAVSQSSSRVMGNFKLGALQSVDAGPFLEGGTIPSILYFVFSTFFPVATAQIFVGAIAERSPILPSLILSFVWTTVVYCPAAYSSWSPSGFLYRLGELDFAGGGPVHVASGVASLSYSFFIGPRKQWKDPKNNKNYLPQNPIITFVGVTIIWCAWLCFNSGTLLAVNTRTAYIMANTQIAASTASLTFAIMEKIQSGRWSMIAACEGAIVGLVNITPSCGYISPYWALITSIFVATVCKSVYNFNEWVGIDDTSRSFVVHGIGGMLGSICTGVFASPYIAGLDGVTEIDGGWIFHNWKQMGYQFAGFITITVWSFVGTYAICFIIDKIPGCKIKGLTEAEEMGMDFYEMAEIDGLLTDASDIEMYRGVSYSETPIIEAASGSGSEVHETKGGHTQVKSEEIV